MRPWFDFWVGTIHWRRVRLPTPVFLGFPCGKESACNAGDLGSIPGLGRSQIPLEQGKATHSSILAWRISWTVKSMGSQRVRHDWATFSFSGSNTSLLIKIGAITINTFLPTRNKFVYSCSIKILALGFDQLLECVFCILLAVEEFSLQTVVEMHEEVVISLWEVRWMWRMRKML